MINIKETKINSPKRFFELDVFRGLAALSVLLFHYSTRYNLSYDQNYHLWFKVSSGYGVNLFFIMSGFVIFMSCHRNKNEKPRKFIINRFARIYPLYAVSVIITTVFLYYLPLPNKEISFGQVLANLTLFPYLLGFDRIDGVYWALYVEVSFYLLMYAVLKFKLLDRINTILWLWLLSQMINELLFQFLHIKIPFSSFFLLKHGHLFISGIVFFKIMQGNIKKEYYCLLFVCFFLQVLQLNNEKTIILSLFMLLFYLFICKKLYFIIFKPLVWLGNISFALFLAHQNIGYIVIYNLTCSDVGPNTSFFIATSISILIAIVLTYAIEIPISKMIRNYYEKAEKCE